jgi:hypothetical protein
MVTDRHEQRAASASRGQDERAARAVSMRPDLVLGGSNQMSATSPAPGGMSTPGQGFDGGTTAVSMAAPTLLPVTGVDAVGGSPGDTAYLRCGGCGATIALAQHLRHDGQLVDDVSGSHESCGAPAAFSGGWGTDG